MKQSCIIIVFKKLFNGPFHQLSKPISALTLKKFCNMLALQSVDIMDFGEDFEGISISDKQGKVGLQLQAWLIYRNGLWISGLLVLGVMKHKALDTAC